MKIKVARLRGINVGGKNSLPMKELRELFGELGCRDISTYIQSGNVVFKSDEAADVLSEKLSSTIEQRFGFEPFVLILSGDILTAIADANPYGDDGIEPKFVHVNFLSRKAVAPDIDGMRERQSRTEHFKLTDHALYFKAPDGIGRSKLAADVEKLIGVPTTGRNWKTVCKLVEMINAAR
jgi:uncharacterized protein (DUF1697 family)